MRLIGGSFGVGSIKFSAKNEGDLDIYIVNRLNSTSSDKEISIRREDVKECRALEKQITQFSIPRFLIALVLFTIGLQIFFYPRHPIIMAGLSLTLVVVSIALGFGKRSKYTAEVTLKSNKVLLIEGDRNDINELSAYNV